MPHLVYLQPNEREEFTDGNLVSKDTLDMERWDVIEFLGVTRYAWKYGWCDRTDCGHPRHENIKEAIHAEQDESPGESNGGRVPREVNARHP